MNLITSDPAFSNSRIERNNFIDNLEAEKKIAKYLELYNNGELSYIKIKALEELGFIY